MSDDRGSAQGTGRRGRAWRFELLVGVQVAYLLVYPWLGEGLGEERFNLGFAALLTTGLMFAALWAIADTRRRVWSAGALAAVALGCILWPSQPGSAVFLTGLAAEAALYLFGTAVIAYEVFSPGSIGRDTIFGAIGVYGLFGFTWAVLYLILETLQPGSFAIGDARAQHSAWSNLLYFSFTALTTTGFGDVTPVSAPASSLVILEYLTGVLYMAVVVARLVGLYSSRR